MATPLWGKRHTPLKKCDSNGFCGLKRNGTQITQIDMIDMIYCEASGVGNSFLYFNFNFKRACLPPYSSLFLFLCFTIGII